MGEQAAEKDIDKYGEDRVLRFFYTANLTLFRIKERTEELPTDVFSPSELFKTENKIVSYNRLVETISRPFNVEKIFEIPNAEISEIYDTSAVMDVETFENTETGGKVNGICGISVLGKTENGVDSVNFNVNFSELLPDLSDCYDCQCSVVPTQATAMITGRDVITVKVSANATIRKYENISQAALSDFASCGVREERDKSCITIYYPDEKETLWNISKEYGINPEEIKKENVSAFSADGVIAKGTKSVLIP